MPTPQQHTSPIGIHGLGLKPPRPNYGGFPRLKQSVPLIPRSKWVDRDFSDYPVPILNQGQTGSCVGHSSATAFWRTWLIQDYTPHDFSACWIYSLINGNSDNGAVISDALTAMMTHGVALLSDVPEGVIYQGRIRNLAAVAQTATRFKVKAAHHCETFDEIGTALQMGMQVVYGIQVGSRFSDLDGNGVPPFSRGEGNHAVSGCGMHKVEGEWLVKTPNSWGTDWGQAGYFNATEQHIAGTGTQDAFAIEVDALDPTDPHLPSAVS